MIRHTAVLAIALAGSAQALAAQATPPDPWQKVPALPTSCYADLDFGRRLQDIYASVGEEKMAQEEINSALERKLQALGQQEITRRLMEYMRTNPQKAMQMMQAQQAAATQLTSGITSAAEAKEELDEEFEQLSAAFKAEMEAGAKPFEARRAEIMRTSRRVLGEGDNWEFATKAAETEYNDLINRQNADYEQRCAAYFGPGGKVLRWLAEYREKVIDPTAASSETHDGIITTQLSVLESPGAGYHSTAQMTAVRDYVTAAGKAFDLRLHKVPTISSR